MLPRSYLFVPGNRPERFAKALASGADAVVLDLEDAVSPDAKRGARDAVAQWCDHASAQARGQLVVRVNDTQSDELEEDLRLLQACGLAHCMLPKAESAVQIDTVRGCVPGLRVLALVETARGIAHAHDVAAAAGVERLVFGTLDFALDLDLRTPRTACRTRPAPWRWPRAPPGCPPRWPASRRRSATWPACAPTWRGRADTAWAPSCASTRARSSPSTRRWRRPRRRWTGLAASWRPRPHRRVRRSWTAE
jgi:hypothetical protein